MERIRQVRDVIWTRQKEERKADLVVKEIMVRYLAGTTQSAAGNTRGAKAAQKFRLVPREKVEAKAEAIARRFPVDENAGGLIPIETLLARRAELAAR